MQLSFTSYLGRDPETLDDVVAGVVPIAAACAGLELADLADATVRWDGEPGLTELRVAVPIEPDPAERNRRTLNASRFAAALTAQLHAA